MELNIEEFIEAVFRVRDSFGKLNDYKIAEPHKILLKSGILGDRTALTRIINKGRQAGFSTFSAVEFLTIAQLMPNTNQFYVATKEEQAKNWLKKVERMALDTKLMPDSSRLIDIDTVASSQLEKLVRHMPDDVKKGFEYSYITGLAASPGGIRGSDAINVLVDEWAWMVQRKNQQREVYDAVKYFVMQGGQLTLQSTPYISTDLFMKTYQKARESLMTPFYFPIIENLNEIDINRDLRYQPCKIPYPWINLDKLEQARRDDLEYFKQECLGIPSDVMYRCFPPELIYPCVDSIEKFMNKDGSNYKIGIDVAQKRDMSAITVCEFMDDGSIWERWVEDTQLPYPQQYRDVIKPLIDRYNPIEIIIDNTGIGVALSDIITDNIPEFPLRKIEMAEKVVIKTEFVDGEEKEKKISMGDFLYQQFKGRIYDKTYHMIDNQVAINHILNVEKVESGTGTKITGKTNGKRDDHFWSKTFLVANFDGVSEYGNIPFSGILEQKKNTGTVKNKYATW